MNKISKNIILTYAKGIRTIQTEQIDPYLNLVEAELIKLFPELKDRGSIVTGKQIGRAHV